MRPRSMRRSSPSRLVDVVAGDGSTFMRMPPGVSAHGLPGYGQRLAGNIRREPRGRSPCNGPRAFARLGSTPASIHSRGRPSIGHAPCVTDRRRRPRVRASARSSARPPRSSTPTRYPHALVERMRELGLFGALVPAELRRSRPRRHAPTRGSSRSSAAASCRSPASSTATPWPRSSCSTTAPTSSGARFLPRFARGEARGGLCLTEPHAGSDVQAIRTVARRDGDRYLLSGLQDVRHQRPRGQHLRPARPDRSAAEPPHRGMSCFIVEKGAPGLEVVKSIGKLGYKGVDTAELVFDGFPCPAAEPRRRRGRPRDSST